MHVAFHHAAHDIPILAELLGMTSEELLAKITFDDTMILAYVLRLVPQGLKPLERRFNGRIRDSYMDIVREPEQIKSVAYLRELLRNRCSACDGAGELIVEPIGKRGIALPPRPVRCTQCEGDGTGWPSPDERIEYKNGRPTLARGHRIGARIRTVLRKLDAGQALDDDSDVNDEPEETDTVGIRSWWTKNIPYEYRLKIEDVAGPMPEVSLDDVVPQSKAVDYSAADADGTLRIYEILSEQVRSEGLQRIYEIDRDTVPLLTVMMEHGTYIDVPYLRKLDARLEAECDRILYQLEQEVGHYVNPGSSKQVGDLLFGELRLPVVKETKGGDASTQDKVLEDLRLQIAARENSTRNDMMIRVIGYVTDYRERHKLRGTYTLALPRLADRNSRLHTTFKSTRTETNRLSSANPNLQNCFSGDTEVLTYEGWTRFDKLSKGIHVAQWGIDGTVSFVVPTEYVAKTDDLLRISNEHIDLQVTADHRCLIQHRKTGELRVVEARAYPHDWKQLNAGTYGGGGGVPWTDDELRLLLAVQADGSWMPNGGVDFGFRKGRKIERIRMLLASCSMTYKETARKHGGQRFYVANNMQCKRMYAVLGKLKLLNWGFFLALSRHQIDVVIDEVMRWDGCWTRQNYYASKHKQNADVIATMYILSGKRANVRLYVPSGGSQSWQVDVTHREYSLTTNRQMEAAGRTKVYCCTVPSTYLLVRRNGKTMVTGNCPARSDLGKLVRGAFCAPPGMVLVAADYSQIEVRVIAHASQDARLIDGIRRGLDVHVVTAATIFRTTPEKVTKQQRSISKRITFLILYGGGAERLKAELKLDGIDITVAQAQSYIDAYLIDAYPGIGDYMDAMVSHAKRYGYVEDMFGWRRYLPGVHSELDGVRMEAERMACNAPIQSGAAGIMRLACPVILNEVIPKVRKAGFACYPLMTVHDEFVCEVAIGGEQLLLDELIRAMTGVVKLDVPVSAEGKYAQRWNELK